LLYILDMYHNYYYWIWHSEDRASWYILITKPTRCTNSQIYFWNGTQHVSDSFFVHHQESSTVHTAIHTCYANCLLASSQHNLYDIYLLLCVQCWTPDDGQSTCPKHVEFYSTNKFENYCILLVSLQEYYYWPYPCVVPVTYSCICVLYSCTITRAFVGYWPRSSWFCSKGSLCGNCGGQLGSARVLIQISFIVLMFYIH
jgi:hypothetical protein